MNIINLHEYKTRCRDFTLYEKRVISDVCDAFANQYRRSYPVFGKTEDGDGWCVIFDNVERTGDPSCQIFIHNGLIHHTGKFGIAKPDVNIHTVLFDTLPDVVIEEYKGLAHG